MVTPYRIEKGVLSPKELPFLHQEKIALFSRAGIPVFSKEVWLGVKQMHRAHQRGVVPQTSRERILCLKLFQGFPGGAVAENLPANAGDTGSSPGLGRSHMPRSNQAREPQPLSLCDWSPCSATREAAIVRGPHIAMKSGLRLPQLEKALAQK